MGNASCRVEVGVRRGAHGAVRGLSEGDQQKPSSYDVFLSVSLEGGGEERCHQLFRTTNKTRTLPELLNFVDLLLAMFSECE